MSISMPMPSSEREWQACTCSTDSAKWAYTPSAWRPWPTSAAPGTGTGTPAPDATSRASTTPTASIPSWRPSGRGARSTPPNPRSSPTCSTWPTSTTCGETSGSRPASITPNGTTTPASGPSTRRPASSSAAGTTSWPPVACRHPRRSRSTAPTGSGVRSISPAVGRTRESTSPVSGWRSSARDHPASRRSRTWPPRPTPSPSTNAHPASRSPPATDPSPKPRSSATTPIRRPTGRTPAGRRSACRATWWSKGRSMSRRRNGGTVTRPDRSREP